MSAPTPAIANLYQRLHIGTETEFKGSKVFQYDEDRGEPCQIAYDMEIAKTAGNVPGFSIPYVTLATEDPHGSRHSIIEHKSGPHASFDAPYTDALARANQLLVTTLKQACSAARVPLAHVVGIDGTECVRLAEILNAYNAALSGLGRDPAERAILNNFQLQPCDAGTRKWYVCVGGNIKMGRQINVEVPLRNIAYPREAGSDIADQIGDPVRKEHFLLCRTLGIQMVDETFRAAAFEVAKRGNSALTDPSSVKMEKLKALFILYYHVLSVELNNAARIMGFTASRSIEKNAHDVLAKVSLSDLVRTALSDRDKEVLLRVVNDGARFAALKVRLNTDLLACLNKLRCTMVRGESIRSPLEVLPERVTLQGRAWTVAELHDTIFKPGHEWPTGYLESRRYDGETTSSYGAATIATGHKGLTGTGKPLDVIKYPTSGDATPKTEPVIVFEFRSTDHAFSALADISDVTDVLIERHRALLTQIMQLQKRSPGPPKR